MDCELFNYCCAVPIYKNKTKCSESKKHKNMEILEYKTDSTAYLKPY